MGIGRRKFLRTIAGSASLIVLRNSSSAYSYQANQRLNVAIVGCGGRGMWFVSNIKNWGQNLVAMCDVDEQKAESLQDVPRCPQIPRLSQDA